MKVVNLSLSYPHPNAGKSYRDDRPETHYVYRVEQVTDSVEFVPNQVLTKDKVAELCQSKAFKVTTKAPKK